MSDDVLCEVIGKMAWFLMDDVGQEYHAQR